MPVSQCITVFPVELWTVVDFSSGKAIQLYRADYIVLVTVSLKNMPDSQVMLLSQVSVNLAVTPGVNHSRIIARAD